MRPPIDTELLKTFVTIVETQSFTRTGDRLHRTQPAISMQIRRLEEALGKEVFDRTRRQVQLTREGEVLLHYARRILSLSDEAMSRIGQAGLAGVVRIGTSDDYANILLPEILRRFAQAHAEIQVDIVCDNGVAIERRLKDGLIDLALVACRGMVTEEELIRTEELVWIAATPSQAKSRPLPLAVFPEGCVCRTTMMDALDAAGRDWRVGFSSDNIGAIHVAVRSGMGISAVERSLVPAGVRILDQAEGLPRLASVHLCLKLNRNSASPVLDALADEIRVGLSPAPLRYEPQAHHV
ncbi:LysR substrate-binding domain-containing protein [Bosea sp. WAO]|uniref:LysR substrate-binding domain-containing protein n=1 Tax=Bosea sp. WAO TaxID=406341 RepID=UPI00082BB68A|nr:LysR substrate-binding domain-containing protein [Bosea sp. WAO]